MYVIFVQEWKFTIKSKSKDYLFEDDISIDININKNKVADLAKITFKFAWSTPLIPCDVKTSTLCPMKDPRTNWEEILKSSVWIGAGRLKLTK